MEPLQVHNCTDINGEGAFVAFIKKSMRIQKGGSDGILPIQHFSEVVICFI